MGKIVAAVHLHMFDSVSDNLAWIILVLLNLFLDSGSHSAYWGKLGGHMVSVEALANYGGAAVANPLEYELMRKLFPNTCDVLDELLEVMAGAQYVQ